MVSASSGVVQRQNIGTAARCLAETGAGTGCRDFAIRASTAMSSVAVEDPTTECGLGMSYQRSFVDGIRRRRSSRVASLGTVAGTLALAVALSASLGGGASASANASTNGPDLGYESGSSSLHSHCTTSPLGQTEYLDSNGRPTSAAGPNALRRARIQGDGLDAYAFQPPQSFDPLNASNAELMEYGFAVRPTDSDALKLWTAAMSKVKKYLATQPGLSPLCSDPSTIASNGSPTASDR